jgi:hypothetical protein
MSVRQGLIVLFSILAALLFGMLALSMWLGVTAHSELPDMMTEQWAAIVFGIGFLAQALGVMTQAKWRVGLAVLLSGGISIGLAWDVNQHSELVLAHVMTLTFGLCCGLVHVIDLSWGRDMAEGG